MMQIAIAFGAAVIGNILGMIIVTEQKYRSVKRELGESQNLIRMSQVLFDGLYRDFLKLEERVSDLEKSEDGSDD